MELLICQVIKVRRWVSTLCSKQTRMSCSQPFLKCQVLFLLHCSNMLQIEGHRRGCQLYHFTQHHEVEKFYKVTCPEHLTRMLCKNVGNMQERMCNIWTGPYPIIGSIMGFKGECGLDSLHPHLWKDISIALEAVRCYHSNKCHRGHSYFPFPTLANGLCLCFKRDSSTKQKKKKIVINSTSCSSTCVWLSVFCGTQNKIY